MDSFMKLKSEFDNLVSKIKIPGQEVSWQTLFSQSSIFLRFSMESTTLRKLFL